jgi:hypothetical protein
VLQKERCKLRGFLLGCIIGESYRGQFLIPISLLIRDPFCKHSVHGGMEALYISVGLWPKGGGTYFIDV